MRRIPFVGLCLVSLPFLSTLLFAQTGSTASIVGKVRDSSGAAIPGVSVKVVNIDTGLTKVEITDEIGDYLVTPLPIGRYQITAELAGFKSQVIQGAMLQIGQTARFDITLEVGEVSDAVTVTSEAALVKTDTASTSAVVPRVLIKELPLNGRDYTQLAALTAGVVPTGYNIGSVYGQRGQHSTFQVDGIETALWSGNLAYLKPSVDAIEEFSIQKGIYQAEYGKLSGGVVNAAIRSGTNDFHGSLFWFVRNEIFDARNFFTPGTVNGKKYELPALRRNTFGATLGGPIFRNKTFFFGSFEGYRIRTYASGITRVPTDAELAGDFSYYPDPILDPVTKQPFPGNIIPPDRIHPVSKSLATHWPKPDRFDPTDPFNNKWVNGANRDDKDQFLIRVDHSLSENDQLFARYIWEDLGTDNVPIIPDHAYQVLFTNQSGALGYTHGFSPSVINEFRFGATRFPQAVVTSETGNTIAADLGVPEVTRDPRFSGYPNVTISGGFAGFGTGHSLPNYKTQNAFEWIDNLVIKRGEHAFKVGTNIQRIQEQQQVPLWKKGAFTFTGAATGTSGFGLPQFLLGYMDSTAVGKGDTLTEANLRTTNWFFYGQDDWRVSDRLTVNLGLRWEYASPPTDRYGKSRAFDPDKGDLMPAPGTSGYSLVDGDWNNFAPRLGFSYRPFNHNDTAIRAGAGIYYTQMGYDTWLYFPYNPPYSRVFSYVGDTASPNLTWSNPFPDSYQGSQVYGLQAYGITRADRRGYVGRWSLGIQQKILPETILEVQYIGSKATKLAKKRDINQPPTPDPAPVQQRRPLGGDWAQVLVTYPMSNDTYHGLLVEVERRYSAGLYLRGSYTFSRSITDAYTDDNDKYPYYQNPLDILGAEKGLSSGHMAHRLVTSVIWDLPFGQGRQWLSDLPGYANWLLGGWEMGTIVAANGGRAMTVWGRQNLNLGGWLGDQPRAHRLADGSLPDDQRSIAKWFDTAAFVKPADYTFGNAGRNILIGPGAFNVDFALYKNFFPGLLESDRIQFRWEMFNALNHTNFNNPDTNVPNLTFGRITSAAGARQMQFSLKYEF
ncbi:MAG TPA: TonB-dependent receptor [Acidobacteriota bacterium]|nr:TonB-dependent receptor [Acidobacteriota bacterium]